VPVQPLQPPFLSLASGSAHVLPHAVQKGGRDGHLRHVGSSSTPLKDWTEWMESGPETEEVGGAFGALQLPIIAGCGYVDGGGGPVGHPDGGIFVGQSGTVGVLLEISGGMGLGFCRVEWGSSVGRFPTHFGIHDFQYEDFLRAQGGIL